MTREDIIIKLKEIIKPYSGNAQAWENLDEETDFINDLKINSANLVDIVLDIEERFDVVIETADMERMLTVKAAVDIVQTKHA